MSKNRRDSKYEYATSIVRYVSELSEDNASKVLTYARVLRDIQREKEAEDS